MSDYIKEKVEEFRAGFEGANWTTVSSRSINAMCDFLQSALQEMEERTAALRKKIEEKKKELIIEIDGKQYNSIDAGIYNQAIDDILQLIDEV